MTDTNLSRGEQTRSLIIETAYALFTDKGYHGTSMRLIAEQAGLAVSGIYNHFANKEDIFKAIIANKHPFVTVLPVVTQAEGETVEAVLSNAAERFVQEFRAQPTLINLLLIEFVEFKGVHIPDLIDSIFPAVVPFLNRVNQLEPKLRLSTPILLTRSFFGLLLGYVITDSFLSGTIVENMGMGTIEDMVDIYLHGVLPTPETHDAKLDVA